VPEAHDHSVKTHPIMFVTDMAMIVDPEYFKVSKTFYENPEQFADAFSRAWF